jgi:CRISPR-associated DxTHG motif protein
MSNDVKVISFLGTGNYQSTVYVWNGQEKETNFFPEAVFHFIQPTKMVICLTPGVEKSDNWSTLEERFQQAHVPYEPLRIPEGHTAEDLWAIFNALTAAVQEHEQVVFDITHSFRSLPFLSFLVIAYLKAAKSVRVMNVLYGAFEAKDGSNRSPVFDLTPFVTLLDWLTATEQFVQTGNARQLSALLRSQGENSSALKDAALTLEGISQAARLCQPFTLMKEVSKLEQALKKAEAEIAMDARPFGVLRDQIVHTFSQFQCEEQDISLNKLRKEYQLIEWYFDKGQVMQAITLAREWLIDSVTYQLGEKIKFDRDSRSPFEDAINGISLVGKDHPQERGRKFTLNDLNQYGLKLWGWEETTRDLLRELWTDLKNVRNTLDHAEHQPKEAKEISLKKLDKLQEKIDQKIRQKLQKLAALWNMLANDPDQPFHPESGAPEQGGERTT